MLINRTILFYKISVYDKTEHKNISNVDAANYLKRRLAERNNINKNILSYNAAQQQIIEVMQEENDRIYLKLANLDHKIPIEKRNLEKLDSSDIELNSNEVLSPYTLMLIDFSTMIASIISTANTPSISVFLDTMQYTNLDSGQKRISIGLILSRKIIEEIKKRNTIFSIEFKVDVATPSMDIIDEIRIGSRREVESLLRGTTKCSYKDTFNYGRKGKNLTIENIESLSNMIQKYEDDPDKILKNAIIKVNAEDEEFKRETINLLHNRITYKTQIEVENIRNFEYFKNKLYEAYSNKKEQLIKNIL